MSQSLPSRPSVRAVVFALVLVVILTAGPAGATFHFMQIEQAFGGICGDTGSQAIQLRMRLPGQSELGGMAKLVALDANGSNPVDLIIFPSDVVNATAGSRILIGTADLAGATDFTFDNPIPASYLEAGQVIFASSAGLVYWSLSWGGSDFTGSTAGQTTNDADGDFGPPFPGPLPATGQGLLFLGASSDQSSSNAADYEVTPVGVVVTNNSGASFEIGACFLFVDGFESGDTSRWN